MDFINDNWLPIVIAAVGILDKVAQNADPDNKYTWNEHLKSITSGLLSIFNIKKRK